MGTTTEYRHPTPYNRPASRDALMAEAFACILSGRRLPEALCPAVVVLTRPASVEEGCRRIVTGPAAG